MDNSDVILRIRYAASLDDLDTVRVISLGGQELDVATVAAWRASKSVDADNNAEDGSNNMSLSLIHI